MTEEQKIVKAQCKLLRAAGYVNHGRYWVDESGSDFLTRQEAWEELEGHEIDIWAVTTARGHGDFGDIITAKNIAKGK